jgi:putative oxidoreductase
MRGNAIYFLEDFSMSVTSRIWAPNQFAARSLDALQPLVALVARLYVSWQFLKSGQIKLESWDSTLYLFENEYHTPVLSPHVAAVAGTFGELFFPTLLALGLFGRLGAIGLFCVNLMAVIAYSQVLLADGSEAALGQHILWASILIFLIAFGPGKFSLDRLVGKTEY